MIFAKIVVLCHTTERKKFMAQPEKQFENQIKRWLESQGIYKLGTPANKMTVAPCGYYTKRWGGGFTTAGLPDMQIVVNGKCIEAEIKCETGRPSELQIYILSQINKSGGFGTLVYPKDFEKFKAYIMELKK